MKDCICTENLRLIASSLNRYTAAILQIYQKSGGEMRLRLTNRSTPSRKIYVAFLRKR